MLMLLLLLLADDGGDSMSAAGAAPGAAATDTPRRWRRLRIEPLVREWRMESDSMLCVSVLRTSSFSSCFVHLTLEVAVRFSRKRHRRIEQAAFAAGVDESTRALKK